MNNENKDLFELMLASNDNDEQFPVLKAFQSYLDAEREKSRRRQSQITICFLLATIILVVCFCVVGFAFFSKFIEKDNQLTQLLLLERAGIKTVPQEIVVQEAPNSAINNQSTELSALIDELKKEREALEALKAEILTTQEQVVNEQKDSEVVNITEKVAENPVPKKEEKIPVAKEVAVVPTTTSTTTTTTTTTTSTSTTTTTTVPKGPERVEVALPRTASESIVPDGYFSDVMGVITDNNVSVPWHILLPKPKEK